ncbi:hypothetical protein ACN38_g1217, partial [Penicillium nordicum]
GRSTQGQILMKHHCIPTTQIFEIFRF